MNYTAGFRRHSEIKEKKTVLKDSHHWLGIVRLPKHTCSCKAMMIVFLMQSIDMFRCFQAI